MVVVAASLVAVTPPPADLAVLDRLRVVRGGDRFRMLEHSSLEPRTYEAEVRGVVLDAKALDLARGIRRDDVEVLRQHILSAVKQVGVERELQDRAPARVLRKLRIDDLVRPAAERARSLDAPKDVRPAEPPPR